MKIPTETRAAFKAILRNDGNMVAAIASLPEGKTRLFLLQLREQPEQFVGRVSQWIKDQGGSGLEMQQPDILPEGIAVGEVLLRLKHALGIDRDAPEASEYDVPNAELISSEPSHPRDGDN